MAHGDPRTGPKASGQVQITEADGATPQTALEIPDGALFRLESVIVGYDGGGSVDTDIDIHDDTDGTTAGNVSDLRHRIKDLSAGEEVVVDFDGMRDFEEDVLVSGDDNQDGEIEVLVMGTLLTTLADSTGY